MIDSLLDWLIDRWLIDWHIQYTCYLQFSQFSIPNNECAIFSWHWIACYLTAFWRHFGFFSGKYIPNSEWFLVSIDAVRNEVKYVCCSEVYPDVTFSFKVKRRSLFYLCNLIFPMTIIGMLTMLSFLLPAESGECYNLSFW